MQYSTARNLLLGTALQTSLTLAFGFPVHAQPAPNARPTGGVVVGGSASISQTANNTAINQSTQRAAVNWQSFNVGSQQSVTFNQPSAQAVTLNRVVGPDPSQIAGRIDANGQVVLLNQSGVTFYKGAQVNTNGLMVSAIGMTNQSVRNFVNGGKLVLDQPGNPNAAVINNGNITVRQAGLAALVAPQVANNGTITAALGHVVLAGAKTATLDLYGDGLLSLDVNNQVTQAPVGKDGKTVTALVTNTGVIIADGGTVQLTARAADGIVQNLVEAGGKIRAATMGDHAGTISLNGVGGSIIVEGQLSATGTKPGTTGGAIEVATDGDVVLASTARINASGKAGGGTVAIGTTLARAAGGPSVTPTQIAKNVTVPKGAVIKANAIANGDGGRVVILSLDATQIDGQISATGGASGGNGGFVETSGNTLGVTVAPNLDAPHGTVGTWLLDPEFLDVINGPPPTGTEDANFTAFGSVSATDGMTGTPDTISNGILNGSTASVVIQALQTLTVGADINLTRPGQNLTVEAGGILTVSPGVSVSAPGNVILATGGAGPTPPPSFGTPVISIGGAVTSTGGSVSLLSGPTGSIVFGTAGSAAAANVVLSAGTGGITMNGNATLGQAGGAIDISSSGPVSQATTSSILSNTLTSSGGITGGMNLAGSGNTIGAIGSITVTGGDLNVVTSAANLTLTGVQSANNLFYEVAAVDGELTLGALAPAGPGAPATLTTGPSGRITLVADNYNVVDPSSTITTKGGRVELAPFSPIPVSLLGSGGLVINAGLLSIIQTNSGVLEVGGFTNAPLGATTPTPSASSIDIGAALDVTDIANTLQLDANGPISESAGPLTVTNLAGSGTSWTLNGTANAVATLGDIVSTTFGFTDSTDLAVNGIVTASAGAAIDTPGLLTINGELGGGSIGLGLIANNLAVPGSIVAGTLVMTIAGSINETGSMTVGTYFASSGGAMTLTGINHIGTLAVVSASSFALNNSSDLLISTAISAPNISIIDPGNQVTLGNSAIILTSGSTRPSGPLPSSLLPSSGAPGAYIQAANFVQLGTSFVASSTAGPSTLQISTTGSTQFDPPTGLSASGTWLILDLHNGSAAGNVFVDALDVLYGVPGSADLLGTIAGVSGGAAAALGFIQPAINSSYLFNGCVIAAATCIVTPTSTSASTSTPTVFTTELSNNDVTSALGGLYPYLGGMPPPLVNLPRLVLVALPLLPAAAPQLTDPDVVPPNISYLDY